MTPIRRPPRDRSQALQWLAAAVLSIALWALIILVTLEALTLL